MHPNRGLSSLSPRAKAQLIASTKWKFLPRDFGLICTSQITDTKPAGEQDPSMIYTYPLPYLVGKTLEVRHCNCWGCAGETLLDFASGFEKEEITMIVDEYNQYHERRQAKLEGKVVQEGGYLYYFSLESPIKC